MRAGVADSLAAIIGLPLVSGIALGTVAAVIVRVTTRRLTTKHGVAQHGVAADSPPSPSLGPLAALARLAAERPTVGRPEASYCA